MWVSPAGAICAPHMCSTRGGQKRTWMEPLELRWFQMVLSCNRSVRTEPRSSGRAVFLLTESCLHFSRVWRLRSCLGPQNSTRTASTKAIPILKRSLFGQSILSLLIIVLSCWGSGTGPWIDRGALPLGYPPNPGFVVDDKIISQCQKVGHPC